MTTNNPELDAAWAVEPHLENIRAARLSLIDAQRDMVAPVRVRDLESEVTELVLAAKPVPADLVDQVRSVLAAEEAFNHARALLTSVSQSVFERERQIRARAAHGGLTYLHLRVVEIVAGAREAAAVLDEVASADAALKAGGEQTAAWRSLVDLVDQYCNVREAQRTMMSALSAAGLELPGTVAQALARYGEIRGYRSMWPGWASAGNASWGDVKTTTPGQSPPWPHLPDGSPSRDAAFLLWAAGFDVNPLWVPSVAQMFEAHDAPQRSVQLTR